MAVTEANISAAIQAEGYAGATDIATTPTILQGVWRRVLALRRWPFLQSQASLAVAVGASSISLGTITDLGQVDAVRFTIGTEGYSPEYISPESVKRLITENSTAVGAPAYWSEYQGFIILYPKADRAYTVTLDYTMTPAYDPVNIVFPAAHQDVLVWGSIVRKAYRQRDWQAVQFAEEQYRAHLQEMKTTFGLEQRGGTLQVERSDIWDEVSW